MRNVDIDTLLWGDTETVIAVIGTPILTRELLRVESAMPCVWRINALNQSIGNAGVLTQLLLRVGIGRFNQELTFLAPVNTVFSVEIPAETLSARFSTDPAIAAERWHFGAMVAPLSTWRGLEVKVVR